ncbi:MAG: hypothetical protein PVF51_06860 [Nitrospirota bacterium]|jgi:hypothetical protein
MRLIYHSDEAATRGSYWNVSTGELIHCDAGTEALPGEAMTYLKVHPAALLLLGPIFGLAFVLFLPFIGFAMIAHTITSKALTFVGGHLAKEAGFRWQPTMAYFTGKEGRQGKKAQRKDPHNDV